MQNQYVRIGDTAPSVEVFFFNTSDGSARTDLVFNTSGLTLAYRRPGAAVTALTLVTLAAVTTAWASGGFIHLGGGAYRLDLPTAAMASGVNRIALLSTALPAGVGFVPCVIPIVADDLSAAAPTDASISAAAATAVRTNLTTELARIDAPVSGAVSSATLTAQISTLRQQLGVGARFGGPVTGGTQVVVPVYDPGNATVLLGTVVIYRDANNNVVGQSTLTPP